MNKRRICDFVMPKTLRLADSWNGRIFSQAQQDTFKRFINALPEGLINPNIYHPEEGIGIQFGQHFNAADLAIDADRIYVEKLDADHDCWVRDTWFEFPAGAAVPQIIVDFLVQYARMGPDYLAERREDFKRRKQSAKEFKAWMAPFANASPEARIGRSMGFALRREVLYEGSTRNLSKVYKMPAAGINSLEAKLLRYMGNSIIPVPEVGEI